MLLTDSAPLYAVAVGDLVPESPGDEAVVGGESQALNLISGAGDAWRSERIFSDTWYIHSAAIGDIDPRHAGNEAVAVGRSEFVTGVRRDGASWSSERMLDYGNWIYDVAVGDLDPAVQGNETVVVGESGKVVLIWLDASAGRWANRTLWKDTRYLDTVVVADLLPSSPGPEIAVAGYTHNVTLLQRDGDTWGVSQIWRDPELPVSMAAGDLDPSRPGDELVLADFSGRLNLIGPNAGSGADVKELWRDSKTLYDVAVADLHPAYAGAEILTVGWSNRATVLHRDVTAWVAEEAWKDEAYIYGAAAGDFDPYHRGKEALVAGHLGKAARVQFEERTFDVVALQDGDTIPAGRSAFFPVEVYSRGGYTGTVNLSVPDLPGNFTYRISAPRLEPTAWTEVEVAVPVTAAPGRYQFTVSAADGRRNSSAALNLTVLPAGAPDFGLSMTPTYQSVQADYSVDFTLSVNTAGNWSGSVALSAGRFAWGIAPRFAPASASPGGTARLTLATVASSPAGRHPVMVSGTAEIGADMRRHSRLGTLEITAVERPDFMLTVYPPALELVAGLSGEFAVAAVSPLGFPEDVVLNVTGMPPDANFSFSENPVRPTALAALNISTRAGAPSGSYLLTITAAALSGTRHSAVARLLVNPQGEPGLNIALVPADVRLVAGRPAYVNITLSPVNGLPGTALLSGEAPYGVAWRFMPTATTLPGRVTALLSTNTSAAPGNFTFNITAGISGSSLAFSAPFRVEIVRPVAQLALLDFTVPVSNRTIDRLRVLIGNNGTVDGGARVEFSMDGRLLGSRNLTVPADGTAEAGFPLPLKSGRHTFTALLYPLNGSAATGRAVMSLTIGLGGEVVEASPQAGLWAGTLLLAFFVAVIVLAKRKFHDKS